MHKITLLLLLVIYAQNSGCYTIKTEKLVKGLMLAEKTMEQREFTFVKP